MKLATKLERKFSQWRRYHLMELSKIRHFRASFPSIVQFETTSYCNGKCLLCPYETTKQYRNNGIMPDKLFKKIVNECSKHHIWLMPMYYMNEPLTDRKIIPRIKYAKKKNPKAKILLSTNASLMTKELAEELSDIGLYELTISLQGGSSRELYKKFMPGLNYEQTMQNIKYLLSYVSDKKHKLKPKDVHISTVASSKKQEKTDRRYWSKWKVRFEGISLCDSRASNVFKPIITNPTDVRGCNSFIPIRHMFITFDGKVTICCMDWKLENILGDLNNQTIKEVWSSRPFSDVRKCLYSRGSIPKDMICTKCERGVRKI